MKHSKEFKLALIIQSALVLVLLVGTCLLPSPWGWVCLAGIVLVNRLSPRIFSYAEKLATTGVYTRTTVEHGTVIENCTFVVV